MTALSRLDRLWYVPMPAERLAVLRILVGIYGLGVTLVRGAGLLDLPTADPGLFRPIGVSTLLAGPMEAGWVYGLTLLLLLANVAFVLGWRHRVSGPVYGAVLLWLLTYANSWGQILHTENLFCLFALVLATAPSADALSLDARRRAGRGEPSPAPDGRYGWAIRLMCTVVAVAYVLAGVAKIRNAGWAFVTGDTLRLQIGYDNLRKLELGGVASPFAPGVLAHPRIFLVLGVATLALELGAALALLHRGLAAVWAAGMWLFHVGVLALMAIVFPFPLTGLAFAPFFRVEGLLRRWPVTVLFRRPHSHAAEAA